MILLVDDTPENLISLTKVLEVNNFQVDTASSGAEALKKVLKNEYVLIILDVQMPGMDGFEVAEAISGYSKTKDTAIIFLSAANTETRYITKGYTSGGLDYITKPVDMNIILLKVKTFYRIYEQNRKLNEMQQKLLAEIETRKRAENKKDEFISIASHELKTPLTSIKGYVQLLERSIDKSEPEVLKMHIQKASHQLNKLSDLVDDLLDISKMESGKMAFSKKMFPIEPFLKNVVEIMQHSHPGVQLQLENNVVVDLLGDELRIEQVLINFITNAIKYAPGQDRVIINATAEKDFVRFSVRDFGIGIDEEQQKQVFDKFYRVDETSMRFQGLGIGLYISSEIIKRHGGTIGLISELDKGSEFYFTLPLTNKTK